MILLYIYFKNFATVNIILQQQTTNRKNLYIVGNQFSVPPISHKTNYYFVGEGLRALPKNLKITAKPKLS